MNYSVVMKLGVKLADPLTGEALTPCQARIIGVLDQIIREGFQHNLIVSCGREGHVATDPHPRGLALDVRTIDLTPQQVLYVHAEAVTLLGYAFTVLYEIVGSARTIELAAIATKDTNATEEHIHIQAKKGTVWP